MQIVIDLLILLICSIIFYFLIIDSKVVRELHREQLKYYKKINEIYDEEEDND